MKLSMFSRLKKGWLNLWGGVFFIGVVINFTEIVSRTLFHFSVDLMYDLPIWMTIWAVMMLAGPILPDRDHVSVDMLRDSLHGWPRKICEIINCLATITFGIVITWGGFVFIAQCFEFKMTIMRCIAVPRWLVESCVPIGMLMFTLFAVYQLGVVIRTSYAKSEKQTEN